MLFCTAELFVLFWQVAEIKKLVDRELGYIVEGSLATHSKVGSSP